MSSGGMLTPKIIWACGTGVLLWVATGSAHQVGPPHLQENTRSFPGEWHATWPRVPAMIFGANATGPENATQLGLDALYPLVIYGWQHEDNSSDWHHVGQGLSDQCVALKKSGATSLCVVYRSAANSMPWFDDDAAVMSNATRKNTWFLKNSETGEPLADGPFHPDPYWPISQTWYYDFRNPEVRDYFATAIVDTVAGIDAVDGVFFDMVDYIVCGAFAFEPCDPVKKRTPCGLTFPGGKKGMRDYFSAVWGTMRAVGARLANLGKLGIYSSTNFMQNLSYVPITPQRMEPGRCIQPQDDALKLLDGVPFMRYYEQWIDGNAPTKNATRLDFNRSQCIWQIQNALLEAKAGVATGMHTDVEPMWLADPSTTPALLAVETSVAAFLVTAPLDIPSFYGFSFGKHWYDMSYQHIDLYNRDVGAPLGPPVSVGCCDGDLLYHTTIHDAEGHTDLMNAALQSPQQCSSLCCSMDECAGFLWTPSQGDDSGNCTVGKSCCWIKPTTGRLWEWIYDPDPSGIFYDYVSGVKNGLTFRREFEKATVDVRCSEPSGQIRYKNLTNVHDAFEPSLTG